MTDRRIVEGTLDRMSGVAAHGDRAVSLHLYGRNMNSFHVYDVAAGTRRLMDVAAVPVRAAPPVSLRNRPPEAP